MNTFADNESMPDAIEVRSFSASPVWWAAAKASVGAAPSEVRDLLKQIVEWYWRPYHTTTIRVASMFEKWAKTLPDPKESTPWHHDRAPAFRRLGWAETVAREVLNSEHEKTGGRAVVWGDFFRSVEDRLKSYGVDARVGHCAHGTMVIVVSDDRLHVHYESVVTTTTNEGRTWSNRYVTGVGKRLPA